MASTASAGSGSALGLCRQRPARRPAAVLRQASRHVPTMGTEYSERTARTGRGPSRGPRQQMTGCEALAVGDRLRWAGPDRAGPGWRGQGHQPQPYSGFGKPAKRPAIGSTKCSRGRPKHERRARSITAVPDCQLGILNRSAGQQWKGASRCTARSPKMTPVSAYLHLLISHTVRKREQVHKCQQSSLETANVGESGAIDSARRKLWRQ